MSVEIINGYNVIVDSNVTSPSTYAPSAGYIGARICNTGDQPLANVIANVGNYNGGVGSTPGTFPVHNSTGDAVHPQLTNTGNYTLTLESGATSSSLDGSRYIGPLAAQQCVVQYWLFSYPQCVNVGGNQDFPPCNASITGSVQPTDDLALNYDVWASTTSAIPTQVVNVRRTFTMRNEISASANKIWPNTTSKVPDAYLAAIQSLIGWGTLGPDGQPLTPSNPVYPGQRVITTQGIWYDLGNVGHGFDNDGDLIPDQNAWLQPVGDASSFDADCFRMVNVYGVLIVKLKSGGELLIPFQNELYFEHIPDNTGVVGLVYYQFIATDGACSAVMTPYQEAASGFDNEKFSADFGLSNPLSSIGFGPALGFTKTDNVASTTMGSTLTYVAATTNTTGVHLGAPDFGVPMVFRDSIPAGTTYVQNSATANLTPPSGNGQYLQDFTDNDGNVETCTINFSIQSSSFVVLYSTNNGTTWSATQPASGVTDIQWLLFTTLQLDGYHDGTNCVDPNGTFDSTLQTSLPAGKNTTVRFQVRVNDAAPLPGPVICNTALLSFGGATSGTTAQDCTLVAGNNSFSGTVFKDDATGGGIYGNGIKETNEAGIGAGVRVTLYYDLNGNGVVDSGDPTYTTTTTNGSGAFSFSSLPDGRYLVVVKKYDGAATDDATDDTTPPAGGTYGTSGWGNTTTDPNLSLTTDQGVLKLEEDAATVTLAVNIDLDHSDGDGESNLQVCGNATSCANFGFAPPLRLTKSVAGNPDANADNRADTPIDEGEFFTYNISLENRLPSVGVQGPTGCQYTVWAPTGTNGSPASKEFTNPNGAWDGPNRNTSTALVQGGGLKFIQGTGFVLADQPGNITKVEALYFGYFSSILTDDNLTLRILLGGNNNQTTFNTALIDSYVGEPASLSPDSAISWDVTSLKPGGGVWSWTDNFALVTTEVNPSKASSADEKTFFLDAMGLRITTDQNCEAGTSTTLSPVPLQDSYDPASVDFISASPTPNSVNTATGIIQWNDVGPILPGSTATVTVTMRARNIAGTRTGICGVSSPPAAASACNWAETAWGGNNVKYADGRLANDASDNVAISMQGKGEIHGTVWRDQNNDGWPYDAGEPFLPNVTVTLWGCVRADGVTMETSSTNKTCTAATNGNFWKSMATDVTDANGVYDFIGLDTGFYLVEVGDTDGAPQTGNSSPFGGTQTAEPNDTQGVTGGNAVGTNGVCAGAGGCNNTWGNPNADTNTLNLLNSPTAEEVINGVNFGYNIPNAIVYGNIWWDVDADATRDATDGNLSGFTVQRYSDPNGDGNPADGTLQATTTTDANGNYSFSGLAAGSYVVVVTPPTLLHKVWTETHESTGGTGSLNNQIPVTVVAGQISGSHDFGYTQANASDIGDYLYYDFDGDGVKDSTESGIPNVTVWLYEDVDRDGSIDAGVDEIVATTVSDATGHYLFNNFPAGSYVVKVDTDDPDFPTDVLATGDPDIVAASIGDTIFFDANGNGTQDAGDDGIPLVIVNLYSDNDSSGTLNGADSLIASTITDVNGKYLFTGLSAGSYFVDVDETSLPSTSLALTTADPAASVVILAGSTSATSNLTKDAGYSPAANFSIGNRIWHDVDGDGVQDAGEPGIPNVDVVVTNGAGGAGCPAPGCRVTTDEAGFWIVTGLTGGGDQYSVDVDTTDPDFPRDFTLTTGTDPRTVTVNAADLNNVDFAYRYTGTGSSPTGSISGRVFQDADGDLAYDAGEERVGKTVNLLDDQGNIVASTTTSATGTYSFTGVFVGTYNVQAVDQLGTRYSTLFLAASQIISNLNIIYNATTETTADSESSVSIDGVHSDLLQDFGYQRFFGSIGDTVYWDVNENGTQDLGEPGLANVTVRLYDAVWTDANDDGFYQAGEATTTLVATASTAVDNPLTPANEDGTYLFSNLASLATGHQYLVVVDTTTLPGVTHPIIADPDTDGVPCTSLPANGVPASICDSQQLITGFNLGNNYLGADFGYRITGTNFATIGDHLWIDTDGDGVLDSGEVGIDAVTVWLDTDNDGILDWTDGNANGEWDSGEGERWTYTDPEGFYAFTSIADGTYNLKVLTSDPDWPSGLATTPTFEVRSGNTASLNNAVQVVVSGGAVTSIVDGDPATTDTCTSCNLNVDFGYRYAGNNTLSGTVCGDDATKNGYCGATATTHSGVDTANDEFALPGLQVTAYRWTDDGDTTAWSPAGVLDIGDSFVLLGSATADANGDYSFSNLPDNVVLVFSVSDTQNLRLTTTDGNTSVEDANVLKRGLYEGTTLYQGNTVTVIGRQALSIGPDADNIIRDVDYAFDPTLNGAISFDFGDLPATYANTLLSENGAQHRTGNGGIFLGPAVSNETDGTENAAALADTNDDGVTMVSTVFAKGGGAYVDVTASAAGWLVAWIDFNGDGDFDDTDEVILDQAVSAGVNNMSFYVPTTIPDNLNNFFARFRIYPERPEIVASTGPGLDENFQMLSGEVEDYLFLMDVTPTLVKMLTMEGKQGKNHVTISWQTEMEVDNLGFFVYRSVSGGAREQLTPHMITGSALLTGPRADRPRNYRFVDKKPPSGFVQYWIEDVDLDGTATMHGPITPVTSSTDDDGSGAVTTEPDPTLGSVGGIFTTQAGMGVPVPQPEAPSAKQLEEQWSLASVPAVKVIVTKPGWYRVTKAQLVAAGFDPGTDGRKIAVFSEGIEIPVFVNAKNEAKFDSADSIEFLGRGIDTPGTGGRVYYITARKGSGLRVKTTGGRGNSGQTAPPSYPYTFERIERTTFIASLVTNGEAENFFGAVANSRGATRSLTAANIDSSQPATLELVMQGVSQQTHIVSVTLNGSVLGSMTFGNRERLEETFTLPPGLIVNGENSLTVVGTNGRTDTSVVESIRLVYSHRFHADNDALAFTVNDATAVNVGGFTNDKIRVADITDPMQPVFIDAKVDKASDNTYSVSFSTAGFGGQTIFAFADNRVLAPQQVAWNEPSTWNATSNGANLVIITNKAFKAAADKLKATRDAQGISTVVVDVQNIYDEFSFGHHSPQAVRDFLAQAMKWKTVPRYVVLLGDGSIDPRNYLNLGSYDFVPTKLIPTTHLKTASDDWFADFAGSGIPSMAIGRIPARTADQAMAFVNKLVARNAGSTEAWTKFATVVSDAPNGFPFNWAADAIASTVPNSYTVERISVGVTPSPSAAIVTSFNRGSLLTSFIGHGSTEIWGTNVFSSTAASALSNGNRLPFVVSMNCLNGYYHDLFTFSIAEALINNPNGGAIGVWASSALSGASGQLAMNVELNRHIFGATPIAIGDAVLLAKQATRDQDVRRTWILFGDPSMKLK